MYRCTSLFQDFAVTYWLDLGCPKEKLLVGVASFGRAFTLASEDTGLGAPASGPAPPGPYTGNDGFFAYYEVCN